MSKLLFKGPDHELAAERGAIIHWLRNIYWGYDINIVISTHLTESVGPKIPIQRLFHSL